MSRDKSSFSRDRRGFSYKNRNRGRSSSNSSRNSGNKKPPHLRGKEIGLYYANIQKQRNEQPLSSVVLLNSYKQSINALLKEIERTKEKYSFGWRNDWFQEKFIKQISGSLEDKLKNPDLNITIERDKNLDQKLKIDFEHQLKNNTELQEMNRIRSLLTISKKRSEILKLIDENQIVLVSGETGCGKTTQIPQYILEQEILRKNGSICKIVCTQPRRISAISIAERVAEERQEICGKGSVGFQIRLEKKLPRVSGSIIYCTTGVLLKQMESNPFLNDISHLILDEIHERNINSDILLALVKIIIKKRPDLKLILMSATLNAEEFSKYFDNCEIITIPGFMYPVQCFYLEEILSKVNFDFPKFKEVTGWRKHIKSSKMKNQINVEFNNIMEPYVSALKARNKYSNRIYKNLLNPNSEELNLDLIVELLKFICSSDEEGAVLIFLPGLTDINNLFNRMAKSHAFPSNQYLIIMLHSKLSSLQQRNVFEKAPHGIRKIVLSTNIAETSVTIPDVVFVIDCGRTKIQIYDVNTDIECLKPQWESTANAIQRKGRAGRIQAGFCYYLFSKVRYERLKLYEEPEVFRSRLEGVILSLKILQLGKSKDFLNKLINPPELKAIDNALQLLNNMNALDNDENLTPLGYHLAKLPVHPRMGKMILLGAMFSCLDPILTIAASLDFKDAFYCPIDKQLEVNEKKRELLPGWKSDHLLLAEALKQYESAKENGYAKQFCWDYFLNEYTLELLIMMKQQFVDYLKDMKFLSNNNVKSKEWNQNSDNYSLIKAIVCGGLYPNVAIIRNYNKLKKYKCIRTLENERVDLHPSSINQTETMFESSILIYHVKLKSTSIFLHDVSMVHALPLLFFGGKISIEAQRDYSIISVTNQLRFKCDDDSAVLIKQLRQQLDNLLQFKISHPGIVDWTKDNSEVNILKSIMELITSEEYELNVD